MDVVLIVLIVLACWLLASVLAGIVWATAAYLIKKRQAATSHVDERSVRPADREDGSEGWPRGA
jgi:hypothetical protein